MRLTTAINQYGIIGQKCRSIAPNKGPKMNPPPKIAQSIPIFFILSSFVLDISVIIDWRILIFPPVIPLTTLASKNTRYVANIGIINEDTNDQITQKRSIFFLPYISDSCPRIGAAINVKNA